jgi:hypothetical protein
MRTGSPSPSALPDSPEGSGGGGSRPASRGGHRGLPALHPRLRRRRSSPRTDRARRRLSRPRTASSDTRTSPGQGRRRLLPPASCRDGGQNHDLLEQVSDQQGDRPAPRHFDDAATPLSRPGSRPQDEGKAGVHASPARTPTPHWVRSPALGPIQSGCMLTVYERAAARQEAAPVGVDTASADPSGQSLVTPLGAQRHSRADRHSRRVDGSGPACRRSRLSGGKT